VIKPTVEMVQSAYQALGSGSISRISEYYHPDLRWLVPGNHPLAGWHEGRDAFLDMMKLARTLTDGSFLMDMAVIMTGDGFSADLCRNTATRPGSAADSCSPYDRLDIDVLHLLKWRDGKVIEGRDALFGDEATNFSQFWSQLDSNGFRTRSPRLIHGVIRHADS